MRSGALVTLVASSLYLTLRYPSSMELLIPLLASAAAAGEPYERARSDHDAPFSNIPDSAFTLDEGILDADSASHPIAAPQRVHKKVLNSHEEGVDYYRPRSIYVSSMEQRAERPADAWSACRSLLQEPAAAHLEVLLLLCAELLDAPSPSVEQRARDLPGPSTAQPCACCPETARRDYMRMGDNADMVLRYMSAPPRRRPHLLPPPPWAGDIPD